MSATAKHTPGPWEFSGGAIWAKSPFGARVTPRHAISKATVLAERAKEGA